MPVNPLGRRFLKKPCVVNGYKMTLYDSLQAVDEKGQGQGQEAKAAKEAPPSNSELVSEAPEVPKEASGKEAGRETLINRGLPGKGKAKAAKKLRFT
jgi:hypothetical protein